MKSDKWNMKAMTRQQLAACAGITTKTLGNYIKRHWDKLWALGMRPYEILPPSVVEWLSHHYCIKVDDWAQENSNKLFFIQPKE